MISDHASGGRYFFLFFFTVNEFLKFEPDFGFVHSVSIVTIPFPL